MYGRPEKPMHKRHKQRSGSRYENCTETKNMLHVSVVEEPRMSISWLP